MMLMSFAHVTWVRYKKNPLIDTTIQLCCMQLPILFVLQNDPSIEIIIALFNTYRKLNNDEILPYALNTLMNRALVLDHVFGYLRYSI